MPTMLRIPLAVALGVWCGLAPGVWAASATTGPLPRATVVAPEDTPTTYYVRDMDGRIVTVDVPLLGSPAVQVSDPTQGTVGRRRYWRSMARRTTSRSGRTRAKPSC